MPSKKPKNPKKPQAARPRKVPAGEWIGACAAAPFYVTEGPSPQRMAIAMWLEFPADQIVGQRVFDADSDPARELAEALQESLRRPAVGKPRRPAAIRVENAEFAAAVRDVVGDTVDIRVGPVPELDSAFESLFAFLDDQPNESQREQPSYLEGGRVEEGTVEALFSAASVFRVVKPWEVLGELGPLRVDIPQLDLTAACVLVIGRPGKDRGFLMFPSMEHYELYEEAAECARLVLGSQRPAMGSPVRAFTLQRGADLPDTMRREVAAHGWKLDDPESYPLVEHRDEDSVARPMVDGDVRVLAATASALSTFVIRMGAGLKREMPAPMSETYENQDDLAVRVTYPYESFDEFDVDLIGLDDESLNAEWLELEELLEQRGGSIYRVLGILAAAATHPSMEVMPSHWLPLVLGDEPFASEDDARTHMALTMKLYNDIASRMNVGGGAPPPPEMESELVEWCDGYWEGLMLDDTWTRDATAMKILAPVVNLRAGKSKHRSREATPTGRERYEHPVADAVGEAHEYFRSLRLRAAGASRTSRRATSSQKVGRNDPCPCGSGRKYKRCCLKSGR